MPNAVFKPGTFVDMHGTPRTFSEADVRQMAANYNSSKHLAPWVINHDESNPNVGHIVAARFENGHLMVESDKLDPAFKEAANAGRYPKPSIALYAPGDAHNPNPGEWSIRHVSAEQIPAVKGLSDLKFGEGDAPVLIAFSEGRLQFGDVAEASGGGSLPEPPPADPDDEPTVIDPPQANQPPEDAQTDLSLEITQLFGYSEADIKAKLERLKALEAREKDVNQREYLAFAEDNKGRIPGQKARCVAIMQALEGSGSLVAFSEGTRQVSAPVLDQFKEFVRSLPVSVEFREVAGNGRIVPESVGAKELARLAQERVTQAKAEGRTIGYAEAMSEVVRL